MPVAADARRSARPGRPVSPARGDSQCAPAHLGMLELLSPQPGKLAVQSAHLTVVAQHVLPSALQDLMVVHGLGACAWLKDGGPEHVPVLSPASL